MREKRRRRQGDGERERVVRRGQRKGVEEGVGERKEDGGGKGARERGLVSLKKKKTNAPTF